MASSPVSDNKVSTQKRKRDDDDGKQAAKPQKYYAEFHFEQRTSAMNFVHLAYVFRQQKGFKNVREVNAHRVKFTDTSLPSQPRVTVSSTSIRYDSNTDSDFQLIAKTALVGLLSNLIACGAPSSLSPSFISCSSNTRPNNVPTKGMSNHDDKFNIWMQCDIGSWEQLSKLVPTFAELMRTEADTKLIVWYGPHSSWEHHSALVASSCLTSDVHILRIHENLEMCLTTYAPEGFKNAFIEKANIATLIRRALTVEIQEQKSTSYHLSIPEKKVDLIDLMRYYKRHNYPVDLVHGQLLVTRTLLDKPASVVVGRNGTVAFIFESLLGHHDSDILHTLAAIINVEWTALVENPVLSDATTLLHRIIAQQAKAARENADFIAKQAKVARENAYDIAQLKRRAEDAEAEAASASAKVAAEAAGASAKAAAEAASASAKVAAARAETQRIALCVVCMDRERRTTLKPCGHFALCEMCATASIRCPICGGGITESIKTFLA